MGDNEILADVLRRSDTRTSTAASKRFLSNGFKNLLLMTTILFINLSQKLAIFASKCVNGRAGQFTRLFNNSQDYSITYEINYTILRRLSQIKNEKKCVFSEFRKFSAYFYATSPYFVNQDVIRFLYYRIFWTSERFCVILNP